MKTAVILFVCLFVASVASAQTYTQQKPAPCRASGRVVPSSITAFECGVPMGNSVQWQTYNGQFELFSPPFSLSNLNSTETQTEFTQAANGQPGTFALDWSGVGTDGVFHSGTVSGTWTVVFHSGWCYPTIQTSTLEVTQ